MRTHSLIPVTSILPL